MTSGPFPWASDRGSLLRCSELSTRLLRLFRGQNKKGRPSGMYLKTRQLRRRGRRPLDGGAAEKSPEL